MNFNEFMLQNAVKVENEKYVASERFLGEDGQPMEWELRTLTKMEEEEIMRSCYKAIEKNGKVLNSFDDILFTGKVVASSVVYPELNNRELQDSYRTMSNDQLLKAMLTANEYLRLQVKLNVMGSKKVTLNDKVEQAKN